MTKKMAEVVHQTRYRLATRMVGVITFAFIASLIVDLGIYVYVSVSTGKFTELTPNPVTLMIAGFLLSEVRNAMSSHEKAHNDEDTRELVKLAKGTGDGQPVVQ